MNRSKIQPELLTAMGNVSTFSNPPQKFTVLVEYTSHHQIGVAASVMSVSPAREVFSLLPVGVHELTVQEIDRLSEHADVVKIELDERKFHTMLDASVPLIRAPMVWSTGSQGDGIVCGIIDTGVDLNHPDIADRIVASKDFTDDGVQDKHAHGTHVHGIVGGSGQLSNGKYVGVSPKCKFLTAKALANDGRGYSSAIVAAIDWCVANGARTINMSLGSEGPCDGEDIISHAVTAAWEHGVFVAVAAGNSGPEGRVGSPGCAKKRFTVGASDKRDEMANFSSIGPTSDGRQVPDAAFPGVGIISARAQGTALGESIDDHYTALSGTSMATPHCAGSANLLIEKYPDLSPDEVAQALKLSAVSLGFNSNVQGAGRGDVYAAFLKAGRLPPVPITPPELSNKGCIGFIDQFMKIIAKVEEPRW